MFMLSESQLSPTWLMLAGDSTCYKTRGFSDVTKSIRLHFSLQNSYINFFCEVSPLCKKCSGMVSSSVDTTLKQSRQLCRTQNMCRRKKSKKSRFWWTSVIIENWSGIKWSKVRLSNWEIWFSVSCVNVEGLEVGLLLISIEHNTTTVRGQEFPPLGDIMFFFANNLGL